MTNIESINILEIITSILFRLVFAGNTILSRFFFFFLDIDLYFLIPAVLAHIFNPTAELSLLIGMSTKKAKLEIETHPVTTEAKISKCSNFCASYS